MTDPRPTVPLVTRGEWNHQIVVLGVPGTGKSTYALQRALELGRTPCYVLAHDPGWRLPATLPGGVSSRLQRHMSLAAAAAALKTSPGGVHAIACPDGDDVLRLARDVAAASLTAGGGHKGVPVLVILDEAVSTTSASPHRMGPVLREMTALRRHLHCGIVINAQSSQLAHYQMLNLATEIVVFRLPDQRAHKRLQDLGVTEEQLAPVRDLPNYQHIIFTL